MQGSFIFNFVSSSSTTSRGLITLTSVPMSKVANAFRVSPIVRSSICVRIASATTTSSMGAADGESTIAPYLFPFPLYRLSLLPLSTPFSHFVACPCRDR